MSKKIHVKDIQELLNHYHSTKGPKRRYFWANEDINKVEKLLADIKQNSGKDNTELHHGRVQELKEILKNAKRDGTNSARVFNFIAMLIESYEEKNSIVENRQIRELKKPRKTEAHIFHLESKPDGKIENRLTIAEKETQCPSLEIKGTHLKINKIIEKHNSGQKLSDSEPDYEGVAKLFQDAESSAKEYEQTQQRIAIANSVAKIFKEHLEKQPEEENNPLANNPFYPLYDLDSDTEESLRLS